MADALVLVSRETTPQRWIALGVLATAVRDAAAADPGRLLDAAAFSALVQDLGLPHNAGAFLYALAADHWDRTRPAVDGAPSPVTAYLVLHRYGVTDRAELLRWPDDTLAQALGLPPTLAAGMRRSAIRSTEADSPFKFVTVDVKSERGRCCPPFDDPRLHDRFDIFGEQSRLASIVASLRAGVQDRIRASFDTHITASVRDTARQFGIGNVSLYHTDAAGAPFYASGEPIQRIEDLRDKATRPDAETWLANIRRQMQQVRANLEVTSIESYIDTSNADTWQLGGGDGAGVRLEMRGAFGAINVAPTPTGGGLPIDSSNYNDGAEAIEFFGSDHQWQTPIPFGDGTIAALDITGFRLTYMSTNDWLFDSAQLFFRYAVNGHSSPLTKDQPAADDRTRDDDLAHDDQASGWVRYGDEFNFGIVPGSHLAKAQSMFTGLATALDGIEASLSAGDLSNVYVVHGDELVTLLREAAGYTRQGEHGLARDRYAAVLDLLFVLDEDNLTPLDRELLFAVHVLIASSYVASDALPQAYGSFVEAADYTVDDPDGQAYLWHALADLFLRWGDQLYAAAGRDYGARLVAVDRYRKVTDPQMYLTYQDGREDEILDLWLDLAVTGDVVPADRAAWVNGLRIRPVSYSGGTPVYADPLPILEHETVPPSAGAGRRFIRVRLDVAEAPLRRGDLDFAVSNAASAVQAWEPSDARLQARVAAYSPFAVPSQLWGVRQDVLVMAGKLPPPVRTAELVTWPVEFAAVASFRRVNRVPAPPTCAAGLRQRIAPLRIDQVHAHLNVYGVHDEYVPNGRFVALQRLAGGLADRAAYFWSRYVDFLARAEAAAIEEIDAAFMVELAAANVSLARDRVAQASLDVDAAVAGVAATGTALRDAEQTLTTYQDSYQIGLLRFMNAINLSYPPAISVNLGGFVGSLTGADGYDQQFRTRELDYQSAVDRAQAAAQAADFHRRLTELEGLVADDSLAVEQMRQANAADRRPAYRRKLSRHCRGPMAARSNPASPRCAPTSRRARSGMRSRSRCLPTGVAPGRRWRSSTTCAATAMARSASVGVSRHRMSSGEPTAACPASTRPTGSRCPMAAARTGRRR